MENETGNGNVSSGATQEFLEKVVLTEPFSYDEERAGPSWSNNSTLSENAHVKISKDPFAEERDIVILGTGLNRQQYITLEKLSVSQRVRVLREPHVGLTHLVVGLVDGRPSHSYKYLLAIAGHKWVLPFEWAADSYEFGVILPEDTYELRKSRSPLYDEGVELSRTLRTNIFEGIEFFCSVEPDPAHNITKQDFAILVSQLGGSVVDNIGPTEGTVIILSNKSRGSPHQYKEWLRRNRKITLLYKWVVDSIVKFALQPLNPEYLYFGTSVTPEVMLCLNLPPSVRQKIPI